MLLSQHFYFLKRGWTQEGPQEDGDEEALPVPGDKLERKYEGKVDGGAMARCKLEREGNH